MSKARAFVLVGGGQSSVSAAQTLRESGFDGEIIIVGDESHAPYQRPPLSERVSTRRINAGGHRVGAVPPGTPITT